MPWKRRRSSGSCVATPTGQVYATESFRLNADPQVMAASMQAMPAMMQQMAGMEEDDQPGRARADFAEQELKSLDLQPSRSRFA